MASVQPGQDPGANPPPPFDLYLVVLLALSAGAVWLALNDPVLAGASGFGLTVMYLMTHMVRRR